MRTITEIAGLRTYVDSHCLEDVQIERTIRERWLSWPWRPWARTKIEKVPSAYSVMNPTPEGPFGFGPDRFLVVHPQKLDEIRRALNETGS